MLQKEAANYLAALSGLQTVIREPLADRDASF
jgi:hypothetical protein